MNEPTSDGTLKGLKIRAFSLGPLSFVLPVLLGLQGCSATTTFQRERLEWALLDPTQRSQLKGKLSVEAKLVHIPVPVGGTINDPAAFMVSVQRCKEDGLTLAFDPLDQPIMETVSVIPNDFIVFKVSFTNGTNHVVRLRRAVIRLFDPAQNQIEPQPKENIQGYWTVNRPCPSTTQINAKVGTIKLITQNTELLPALTTHGYLFFQPPDPRLTGTWRLAIYDVVTKTTRAGRAKEKVTFMFDYMARKYIDTYQKPVFGWGSAKTKLIKSEEVQ